MLPIIDLSRFVNASPVERQAIADDLGAACESMGFFYVANHGVSQDVIEGALAASKAFFARPREEKLRYERRKGRYRGYIPISDFTETAADRPPVRYEAFLVGREIPAHDPAVSASEGMLVPNVWPSAPGGFREAVLTYQDAVERVAGQVMQAFALALSGGRTDRLFDGFFGNALSNISLLHYLPRPQSGSDGLDDARAHYDTNAITILLPGKVGGLEAMRPDGSWMEVPPLDGCFVVNIGNMMACWSGGRFKSTMHRVHPPLGVDRYSIGYFLVPDYDVIVEPLDREAVVDPAACAPIHAGPNLAEFVASCDAMVPVRA
ncbi:MAG: 2-oxoglutarate and iron-dependent oxygenase domain-containing protein [Rhodovibrionaceae bacterium]|nr:2-oxoglutarate and iron-dependent oxygenase domain-containing protein [Rhodovibrionaceae bacterium]